MERASRVAQQVRRPAALTAELAAKSEEEVSEMCSHPPDLHDEPAAGRTSSLLSTTVLIQKVRASTASPEGSAEDNHGQPRELKRVAALTVETLSFFVKATDKDKASMRPKFEDVKLENFRREGDRWRTRAEEKQTAPRQEGRSVGAVREATEIGTEERSSSGSTSRK